VRVGDGKHQETAELSASGKRYGELATEQAELERWPNEHAEHDYVVEITAPEFTCLCPRSGYPDFATIQIRYIPDRWLIELRSLKLYIGRYRGEYVSHEAATNRIMADLVELVAPRWMEVRGDFNPRGNVHTVVTVWHLQPGYELPPLSSLASQPTLVAPADAQAAPRG
jgi:7-cyano-7-deazaguanine reductase